MSEQGAQLMGPPDMAVKVPHEFTTDDLAVYVRVIEAARLFLRGYDFMASASELLGNEEDLSELDETVQMDALADRLLDALNEIEFVDAAPRSFTTG